MFLWWRISWNIDERTISDHVITSISDIVVDRTFHANSGFICYNFIYMISIEHFLRDLIYEISRDSKDVKKLQKDGSDRRERQSEDQTRARSQKSNGGNGAKTVTKPVPFTPALEGALPQKDGISAPALGSPSAGDDDAV